MFVVDPFVFGPAFVVSGTIFLKKGRLVVLLFVFDSESCGLKGMRRTTAGNTQRNTYVQYSWGVKLDNDVTPKYFLFKTLITACFL